VLLQVNTEPFVLYKLGKLTAEWLVAQGKAQLVPAFNGFQVGGAAHRMYDVFLAHDTVTNVDQMLSIE
jgi:hypothetical protein